MLTTFLPLYILLFHGIAFLLLGILFLWSRVCRQPVVRIRVFKFGLTAILLAGVLLVLPLSPKLTVAIATPEIQAETRPQIESPQNDHETTKPADQTYPTEVAAKMDTLPPENAYSASSLPYRELNDHENAETVQSAGSANPASPQQTPEEANSEFSLIPYLGMLFFLPPLYMFLSTSLARRKLAGTVVRSVFRENRETVAVRISSEIDSPMIFGLWRTILLIPERMTHSSNDYEAAIAHEMAHYRRGDLWTLAYVRFFQYILWPQPLYWGLRGQLLIDQDFLADHDGAEQLADRADYAETLFKLATVSSRGKARNVPQNVLGMAASNKSQLTRRIEMILGLAKQPLELKLHKRRLVLPLILLAVLVFLGGTVRLGANVEEKEETSSPARQENDSYVEKFLLALKEKRYAEAADCLTGMPFIDEWNDEELQKLFESCEKRNAIKRGVHPSQQEKVIVGSFEKYDVPVKKTYPGGGVLWESVIRFRNAAMSIAFAVDQSGKITGFEIAPLPNEPAPESCGWSGGYVIAKNRGYDCTIIVECFDAQGKKLDKENHSWDNLYINLFQKISGENFEAGNRDIWADPSDGTLWKRKEIYPRQNMPDGRLFQDNICKIQILPPGTFRVLLTAFQWDDDNTGSGNAFSEPITLDAAHKEKTIKLRLQNGGSLVSNIVDATTGKTLDACMTNLSCTHVPQMVGYGWHVKHNGRTRYDYLVPGKYTFEIYCPDFQASDPVYEPEREQYEATVEANKETVVEIKMNSREHTQAELDERWPYILVGTVRDTSGEPLADATVTVRRNDISVRGRWPSSSTTSDKEGKFTLRFNPYALQTMMPHNPPKPTPENPDCMEFRLELEKEGYVWKGTRNSNGEIQGGELDETGKAATYSTHFCIDPVPNDLTKLEHGWGENKRKVKPEEVAYRLKPYKVEIVMEAVNK